jgi:hypothetical protein
MQFCHQWKILLLLVGRYFINYLFAFGESLSFYAQKKGTKEKGTLPLLLRKRKEASAQQP